MRSLIAAITTVLVAFLGGTAIAQPEAGRFFPTAPQAYDYLGTSVDVSGNVMIAGAPGDNVVGAKHAGSAYIYRFDGVNWNFEQRVISSAPKENGRHGSAVAIDGTDAVIAGTDQIQTFRFNGSSWVAGQLIPITASSDNGVPQSVSMDNGVIAVGRQYTGGASGGEVYVFRDVGGTWTPEQVLLSPGAFANAQFGTSVSVRGNRIAVGSPKSNSPLAPTTGMVFFYLWNGTNWTHDGQLHASDGFTGDLFGQSIELDDDRLIVGAPGADSPGHLWTGVAYIMRKDSTWVLEQKLDGSHTNFWGVFGNAVAINDDFAIIGSKIGLYSNTGGGAFAYQRAGTQWVNDRVLSAGNPHEMNNFGAAVAIDGDTVVSGAPWSYYPPWALVGSAHMFDLNEYPGCPGTNGKIPKLLVPDEMEIGESSGNLFILNAVPNGHAFLAVSPLSGSLPLGGGCVLETLPPLILVGPFALSQNGDMVTSFAIPASFPPASITMQVAITDPAAPVRVTTTARVDIELQ